MVKTVKKRKRSKNGIAKALRTSRYKMRVVKDKREKDFLKRINKLLREADKLFARKDSK